MKKLFRFTRRWSVEMDRSGSLRFTHACHVKRRAKYLELMSGNQIISRHTHTHTHIHTLLMSTVMMSNVMMSTVMMSND